MIQQFLEWLGAIGLPGLFLIMLVEGSSLPFPGVIFVLSYGYLLSPGYLETAFIAFGMSICYSLASLVPYFLGLKLDGILSNRLKKGLKKGELFFKRYGLWSIALSRPFGIGNYISYIAGVSSVKISKYLILTFLGIYPWSYVMILLGVYFNGNYEAFKNNFSSYSIYGYGVLFIVIGIMTLVYFKKIKQDKGQKAEM